MIIDFHTHTFPDQMASKAIAALEEKASFRAYSDGTMSGLKKLMEEGNVDISVVLPVITNPKSTIKVNDCAIENNKLDGIISFGGMHPDYLDYELELKRLKDNGIKGIKIHPDYQGVRIDDDRYINIIDKAFELDLIVITHAGIDYGFPDDVKASPDRVLNCLSKLKNKGKFVLAHLGETYNWNEVIDKLCGKDIYFDTAFCFGDLWHAGIVKPLIDEATFIKFIEKHGADKILFATDSPWMSPKESLRVFNGFKNISVEDKEKILYKNAMKLLSL